MCRWSWGTDEGCLASVTKSQLLQASLLEERLGGGVQWLENLWDGLSWVQEEIKSGTVSWIKGRLLGRFTFTGPSKREWECEVLGEDANCEVVLFAEFFVSSLDTMKVFFPFFHVPVINVWEGAREGLDLLW